MIRDNILNAVEREQIIAILRGLPQEQCVSVAQALYEGGIRMIEVTFDQKSPESFLTTADTIRAINQHMGDKILVGAGTVTSVALVNLAADAGAKYIISPDVNTRVIEQTRNRDLVSMPGAMTPSEVMTAHVAGTRVPMNFSQSVRAMEEIFFSIVPCLPIIIPLWLAFSQ